MTMSTEPRGNRGVGGKLARLTFLAVLLLALAVVLLRVDFLDLPTDTRDSERAPTASRDEPDVGAPAPGAEPPPAAGPSRPDVGAPSVGVDSPPAAGAGRPDVGAPSPGAKPPEARPPLPPFPWPPPRYSAFAEIPLSVFRRKAPRVFKTMAP